MDREFEEYLKEYVENVEKIGASILKVLKLNTKQELMEYRYANDKYEFSVGDMELCFHGAGCLVKGDGIYYDWNFGYGSRWCGINPILLESTMKNNGMIVYTRRQIIEQCEKMVSENKMYKKCEMYYHVISEEEMMENFFPSMFDTMIISHFEDVYVIERNKLVDNFLRKARWGWCKAKDYYDNYILRFMDNGKEVYKTYFCDVGYSDKSIMLMKNILSEARKSY